MAQVSLYGYLADNMVCICLNCWSLMESHLKFAKGRAVFWNLQRGRHLRVFFVRTHKSEGDVVYFIRLMEGPIRLDSMKRMLCILIRC